MRIYLAGSLNDDWRDQFRLWAPQHEYLDPSDHRHVTDEDVYTLLDLEMVSRSDMVVARMTPSNRSGYGASVEIGYAHGLNIPVLLIDGLTPAGDWRATYWGMHRSLSFKVVATDQEAIDILNAIPGDSNVVYFPPRFA